MVQDMVLAEDMASAEDMVSAEDMGLADDMVEEDKDLAQEVCRKDRHHIDNKDSSIFH